MAESLPDKKARARKILSRLARAYPDARTELHFATPLDLLVATILSAQCTDERVNAVTAELFPRYRQARDWADLPLPTLEKAIHSTGFFRAKARSIVGMARGLVERHGGEVPRTLEELVALPGVGRKTANVVLGNAFGIPALAVDTHVFRVSQRLGLPAGTTPRTSTTSSAWCCPSPAGPGRATCSSCTGGGCASPGARPARPARWRRSAPGPARPSRASPRRPSPPGAHPGRAPDGQAVDPVGPFSYDYPLPFIQSGRRA